jgi:hypothetical protein
LSVVSNVAEIFARLGIVNNGSARHIDVLVLAICTRASTGTSVASVTCKNVPVVTKVEQRPEVVVASQIHVSSTPTVSAIRTAIGNIFGSVHVHRPASALTRTAANLDVIYEIAFAH